jgi:hypothetical protein
MPQYNEDVEIQNGHKLQIDYDDNYHVNLNTIKPYGDPLLQIDRGIKALKDLSIYGFVGMSTDQQKVAGGGALLMGHGFTSSTDAPQISLTDSELINYISYSENFLNDVWTGYDGSKTNITNGYLCPDGTNNTAYKIQNCGQSGGCRGCYQSSSPSLQQNHKYTASIWLKGTYDNQSVMIGLNDSYHTTVYLTTDWKRYFYTVTIPQGGSTSRGLQFNSGITGDTYYVWGAQLEEGPEWDFPDMYRSYVKTENGPNSKFDTLYLFRADGNTPANLHLGNLKVEGSAYGIVIGGDVNLYRSAANVLKTDDAFVVGEYAYISAEEGDVECNSVKGTSYAGALKAGDYGTIAWDNDYLYIAAHGKHMQLATDEENDKIVEVLRDLHVKGDLTVDGDYPAGSWNGGTVTDDIIIEESYPLLHLKGASQAKIKFGTGENIISLWQDSAEVLKTDYDFTVIGSVDCTKITLGLGSTQGLYIGDVHLYRHSAATALLQNNLLLDGYLYVAGSMYGGTSIIVGTGVGYENMSLYWDINGYLTCHDGNLILGAEGLRVLPAQTTYSFGGDTDRWLYGYFYACYAYDFEEADSLDDLALAKNYKTKTVEVPDKKGGTIEKSVIDPASLPFLNDGKGNWSLGAANGFLLGCIKQLVLRVEKLEGQLAREGMAE